MFKKLIRSLLIMGITASFGLVVTQAGWSSSFDVNGDGCVDVSDLVLVANYWHTTPEPGSPYDVDNDGDIDIVDLTLVAAYWGDRCGPLLPLGVQPDRIDDPVIQTRVTEGGFRGGRLWINWGSPAGYDPLFRPAAGAGLEILALIGAGPSWAYEDVVNNYTFGPIDEEDLDAFAVNIQALVERYDGDGDYDGDGLDDGPPLPEVTYWEFGNEPDNKSTDPDNCVFVGGLWGAQTGVDGDSMPDPEEYARMLSYAYPAVKAGNPEAQVVFGALAYEKIAQGCFEDPKGPNAFLDQARAAGAGPYFDVIAFHQ